MSVASLLLYGDKTPGIAALLASSELRQLIAPLLRAEAAESPLPRTETFESAVEEGLLAASGKSYRPGDKLVVIPAHAERDLPALMGSALTRYAEIASDAASELHRITADLEVGRHNEWSGLSHPVVAGLMLDLAVGDVLLTDDQIQREPVGGTVVWAFEQISGKNSFGVQWWPAEGDRAMFAQLWHRTVPRGDLRLSPQLVDCLLQEAGLTTADSPAAAHGKHRLYLRHLGFLKPSQNGTKLPFPVFGQSETRELLPTLSTAGRRLVEEGVKPALDVLVDHPWWGSRVENDAYRHAAVRLILEYGVDRALETGALPPFPATENEPPVWGRWLWQEPGDAGTSLIPSSHTSTDSDA